MNSINSNQPSKIKNSIFSRNKKIFPDIIPLVPKSRLKNSSQSEIMTKITLQRTKTDKEPNIEPEIIFDVINKPDNICKHGNCMSIDIKDSEIGIGYCSTKCVVEDSHILFQQWLFKRNYNINHSNNETEDYDCSITNYTNAVNNDFNSSKIENKQTKVKNMPITLNNNIDDHSIKNKDKFLKYERKIENLPLKAVDIPNSVIENQHNIELDVIQLDDDDVSILPSREPLFNMFYEKFCIDKKLPFVEKKESQDSRESSPDVIFVSHEKRKKLNKRKNTELNNNQRKLNKTSKIEENEICIVID